MPSPEDRTFFEGLNKDLAKGINKAIAGGFKGASISLDSETVKLLGAEFSKSVKGLKDPQKGDDGGGGGGSGSAGEGSKFKQILKLAKGTFRAARGLVAQNASNILSYGDTMARSAAASNQGFLMNGDNLTRKMGHFGMNLKDMGELMNSAIHSNIRGLGKNTQNFMARSKGLGTDSAKTNKFLAANTNILGKSMSETIVLGTDLQNIALSNGMIADSIFEAVAAFETHTKDQTVIFGKGVATGFQKIVGGLAGLMEDDPGMGDFIKKLAPTSFEGLQNLDRLSALVGGNFGSNTITPGNEKRHTAEVIAGLARFANRLDGLLPKQRAIQLEQLLSKNTGMTAGDLFKAQRTMEAAGGTKAGLIAAMEGGSVPIKSDAEYADDITQNSIEALNNMKNYAIEVEGLSTVQKGLAEVSDILKGSFYDLNGATSDLAKAMGSAAAVEAGLQGGSKLGLGGLGSLASIASLMVMPAMGRGGARGARGLARTGARGARGLARTATSWSLGGAAAAANVAALKTTRIRDPLTGAFRSAKTGVANPLTKAGRSTMRARQAAGLTKGVAKGVSKKIPLIGAALEGVFEYQENKDKSRAAAVTGGAGLGAWGGAAGGAAIGTLIFPGVGTAIGGLIGGLAGMWAGKETAKVVHDEFDTDFVQEQEARKAEEANVQASLDEQNAQAVASDNAEQQLAALDIAQDSSAFLAQIAAHSEATSAMLAQMQAQRSFGPTPGMSAIGMDAAHTQVG